MGEQHESPEMDDITKEELEQILLNTQEQGQMIEEAIKTQIAVKDAMIEKLYSELAYYKQETADRFVDQVMKGIIKVRKDLAKQIASERFASMDADALRQEYIYCFEDLTDLLEQQNIDAYRTPPGMDFDASIHQPKQEPTTDPALDKKIKASLSEGYKKNGKVLIPERVVVYRYMA